MGQKQVKFNRVSIGENEYIYSLKDPDFAPYELRTSTNRFCVAIFYAYSTLAKNEEQLIRKLFNYYDDNGYMKGDELGFILMGFPLPKEYKAFRKILPCIRNLKIRQSWVGK